MEAGTLMVRSAGTPCTSLLLTYCRRLTSYRNAFFLVHRSVSRCKSETASATPPVHMGAAAKDHPKEYLGASALAAAINYPLWRASAVGQSGFRVVATIGGQAVPASLTPYIYAFAPPYKGMVATVLGMTWARAAIFWGSDYGKDIMRKAGYSQTVSTLLPPLLVSTAVQCINMPIVRATITIQDPQSTYNTVTASLKHIYRQHGIGGLWHGTSAGILKSVPKYCTAIVVKDIMEEWLKMSNDQASGERSKSDYLWKSAYKSVTAGLAGAALTNPVDVIRNEMFKTNLGLTKVVRLLYDELGWRFVVRGLGKNMVAVAIPVACTIFFTDAFIQLSKQQQC